MIVDIECVVCRGDGQVGDHELCPRCEGTGTVAVDLSEEIDDD